MSNRQCTVPRSSKDMDAPGFELTTSPIPQEVSHDSVLLKVLACGVCCSDCCSVYGIQGAEFPTIPGHEVIGKVAQVGAGAVARVFKEGDVVGVGWHGGHCLSCEACTDGDFMCCEKKTITGVHLTGGYQEYMVAPAKVLARVPKGMDPVLAAPLMCAGVTVFNSLRNVNGKAKPPALVAVVGIGGLGHLAIQYAAKFGYTVVAVSRGTAKKDYALQLGASHFINSETETLSTALQALGGAKIVLWTAPNTDLLSGCIDGLSRNGKLVVLASTYDSFRVSPSQLISKRKSIVGWPAGTNRDSQAFDIDGVLVRGPEVLPGARESLRALEDARVPFVFVTNGGGCTEEAKAKDLTEKLGVGVRRSMVILSHSPMRTLAPEYSGKRVMVLGSSAKQIAEEDLGLSETVTPEEFAAEWPGIFHFTGDGYYVKKKFPQRKANSEQPRPVAAVMVLHDPLDWALEVQVVVDVLRGGTPPGSGGGSSQTPMHISNPDFVFASAYQEPRFAAGAFADTVRMLYSKRYGTGEPEIEVFGKPTRSTFDYARQLLEHRSVAIGPPPGEEVVTGSGKLERIYMVGDNPSGDIRGANKAGPPWVSSLVRTGVYQDTEGQNNDASDPAHFVHDHVGDCVDFVLEREARRASRD